MDFIVKKYIEGITINDLNNLLITRNIIVSNDNLDTLYFYLKNRWEEVYRGNSDNVLNELKDKLNEDVFIKLKNLYLEYKNKI